MLNADLRKVWIFEITFYTVRSILLFNHQFVNRITSQTLIHYQLPITHTSLRTPIHTSGGSVEWNGIYQNHLGGFSRLSQTAPRKVLPTYL